jgi:Na+/proline symporter
LFEKLVAITPSPTTNGWVTPLILFVFVVIIIAGIAYKIKHRGGKYRERQYFPDSIRKIFWINNATSALIVIGC